MSEKEEKKLLANPTKFGLAGIAIALTLIGFGFAKVITLNGVVLATTLTMGVIAPILAGIAEFAKGNSFRATSLTLISLFFLTFYIFSTRTLGGIVAGKTTLGIFYLVWTLVTALIMCGTIVRKMDAKLIVLQVIICTFLLFTLLLGIAYLTQVTVIFTISGIIALICAAVIFVDFTLHICERMGKQHKTQSRETNLR